MKGFMSSKIVSMVLACVAFAGQAAQADTVVASRSSSDIVTTAVAAGQFSVLAKLLNFAGLVDTLRSEGPFTVFAPTDDAFALAGITEELLRDKELTKRVLLKHVVKGEYDSSLLINTAFLNPILAESFSDQTLNFSVGTASTFPFSAGSLIINGSSSVVKADIFTSNGVIHIVDRVIF